MTARQSVVLAAVAVTMAACADPVYVDTGRDAAAVLPWQDAVEYRVGEAWHGAPPDCIAILPLAADPGAVEGAAVVRRALYAHLAPQARRFVPLARADRVAAGLAATSDADAHRRRLGEALHCGAVLEGRVTDYSASFYGVYSNVAVGAELELRRTADGALLWQGRHVAHSHGGSVPLSAVGAAMGLLDAAANLRDEQMLRVTDDLTRRLAATMPDDVIAAYDDPAPEPVRLVRPAAAGVFLAGLAGMEASERRAALRRTVESRRFTGADGEAVAAALLAAAPDDAQAEVAVSGWRLAEGDHAGALAAAERAAALDPGCAQAHYMAGRVLLRDRAFDRAEPALLKAVALDRSNPAYLNALGALNGERGAADRALAAYRMATEADPHDAFAWYNTAVIHYNAGHLPEAADAFARAALAYAAAGDPGRAEKALADLGDVGRQGVPVAGRIETIQRALSASTRREI